MNENTFWILLSTAIAGSLGLLLGLILGDEVRRRQDAEAIVADLRQQIPYAGSIPKAQDRQLKEMRSVLNDAHKHILAVSKGLKKPAL